MQYLALKAYKFYKQLGWNKSGDLPHNQVRYTKKLK